MSALLEKLAAGLADMGGTHTLEDILDAIDSGHMQSFVEGDTWAVTQILDFPRKRVLEIVLVVGTMAEAEALHDKVIDFAKAEGCDFVRTLAREGWAKRARTHGWINGYRVFLRGL